MSSDFAKRLLSACSASQSDIDQRGLGAVTEESAPITLFDRIISHRQVRTATRSLFRDGYYALAVEQAFKALNNHVKKQTASDKDGSSLMQHVFSANRPILKLNSLLNPSDQDEQVGYQQIFAGCMTGIRNPRAHEHEYLDEPLRALELLTLAQHLFLKVDVALAASAPGTGSP